MKQRLLILAVLQVAFTGEPTAQLRSRTPDCSSIGGAWNTALLDGTWGVVLPGGMYTITPSGFKEPPGPGEGAGIVVNPVGFEIRGTPGGDVTVHLTVPAAFVSEDSVGLLQLGWWTYGWGFDDPWMPCPGGGPLNGDSVMLSLDSNGVRNLYVGATVNVPIDAKTVSYRMKIIASYPGPERAGPRAGLDDASQPAIIDTTVFHTIHVVAITDVGDTPPIVTHFALHPNYPNPFNPSTKIAYEIPVTADVRLSIFNVIGQEVAVLVNDRQSPGSHLVAFDAGNLPSGVYVCRITAGMFTDVKMMLLMR